MQLSLQQKRPLLVLLILFVLLSCGLLDGVHGRRGGGGGGDQQVPSTKTIFLPRDIAFDKDARKALQRLRQQNNDESVMEDEDEENKILTDELSSCGNEHHVTLTLVGYKGGALADQINQDRATIVLQPARVGKKPPWIMVGVFDGHGRLGEVVSEYTVTELPKRLEQELEELRARLLINSVKDKDENNENDHDLISNSIAQILKDAFVSLDTTVPTKGIGGCTASVVLEYDSKLYIANAGDSISLIASYTQTDDVVRLLYVTREDKPHLPDERKRIEEEMGGTVYIPKDLSVESSRVLSGQTGLAMSRSIGDWDMTGVIALPIVHVLDMEDVLEEAREMCSTQQQEEDSGSCSLPQFFAVSATDGMTDYIQPQELAEAFATAFYRSPTQTSNKLLSPFTTAEDLILLAAKGWNEEMGGQYRDDIAVSASKLGIQQQQLL